MATTMRRTTSRSQECNASALRCETAKGRKLAESQDKTPVTKSPASSKSQKQNRTWYIEFAWLENHGSGTD